MANATDFGKLVHHHAQYVHLPKEHSLKFEDFYCKTLKENITLWLYFLSFNLTVNCFVILRLLLPVLQTELINDTMWPLNC